MSNTAKSIVKSENRVRIEMDAKSRNESFARVAAAAFISEFDPLVSDVIDVKTAVSEAVTNAVIHGYERPGGTVYIDFEISDDVLTVSIKDDGVGIDDIELAMEPLYTSKPDQERSGMGFTVMETFMDSVVVHSEKGRGTEVIMTKRLSRL
jgi:stage II sporulation protein AB (anti-sigma F factor)